MYDFNISVNDLPDDENSYELLPPGWYDVSVEESEAKVSQKGGRYLQLKLKIFSENGAGRVVFDIINFENANEVAERIGKATLKKIMIATGMEKLGSDQDFVGKVFSAKLGIQEAKGNYEAKNNVKDYKALGRQKPSSIPSSPMKEQPATEEKEPWL